MSEHIDEKTLLNWQRSSQEIFEHEPRELYLSVDGDVKTTRKIEKNLTEFNFELASLPEFIEIFSEQNVCLAFVSFAETDFEENHPLDFNFSENRKISLNFVKNETKIILDAFYENPHFEQNKELAENIKEDISFAEFLKENPAKNQESEIFSGFLSGKVKERKSFIEKIRSSIIPSFVGLKTAFAGGSLAVLVITAIIAAKLFIFVPNISATEIIRKAANIEQLHETDKENVVYRVLNLEEKNSGGETIRKRKIEFFNDAVRKLSVRRLFDENDRLIAGEWRRNDGVSTLYAAGKMSELRLHQTDKDIIGSNLENIWQLSVSAKGFESLCDIPEKISVEEDENIYRINYLPEIQDGVTKAVLTVNKNMRAEKLVLAVNHNNSPREFHFTEAVFEQKPRNTVEKIVFEPNVELLGNSVTAGKNNLPSETPDQSANETKTDESDQTNTFSNSASVELEVKVLQSLNNVNALSGDQISIVKTPNGKIQIKGIVDAKTRKDEILGALSEFRGNPSISVNVLTAEEAAKNKPSKDSNGTLESISVESKNSIPAGEILRKQFSAQGISDDKIEAEIRQFSSGTLSKSSQIRRSALQLKQIAERFSPAELEKMDEATRNNWRKLIKQNAANLAQNSQNLQSVLQSTLQINAANGGGNVNSSDDAELIRTAKKLFDLSLTIDRDVRSSFSNSGGNQTNIPVKSAKFAENLGEIISLAKQMR